MHKICFTISLFHASTCFEYHVLIVRRSKLYHTASDIITPIGGRPVHRCTGRPPTGMISKHVEAWNKLILTYLLTPWSRVLLEKLASLQLGKKFPVFYGTRRFLTALTSARHLSISWASPIQSSYPNPTSWRSILILSSHLRLGLPSGIPYY